MKNTPFVENLILILIVPFDVHIELQNSRQLDQNNFFDP